ncbi:MAG: FAD-binding oxidoreductase [Nakamurella sp.]
MTEIPVAIGGFPADPVSAPTQWQTATVREVLRPTARLVILRLELTQRQQQYAGQHFVVRLTADDGYAASRSYSVSSAPEDDLLELCVERLSGGEVSGYLYDVVEPGDSLEVRGPIGGWFVWDGSVPAVAVGGGTGVVPLAAMLRHASHLGVTDRLRLAVSGRTGGDIPFLDEFRAAGATVALTGAGHRLDADDLRPLVDGAQIGFVCGSARFAEALSSALVKSGMPVGDVRVERFGPTG